MKKSDFYYDLPPELIAQTPIERRDASRLMCLDKTTGASEHRRFNEFPGLLRAGDCLVMNDSRVLPARLLGEREATGGAVELVLLNDRGGNVWECLSRPGKRTRTGTRLCFGGGELTAEVTGETQGGNRLVKFSCGGIFLETLDRLGKMPLPPYIKEELKDRERYQTVYSKEPGSAAAPTAGLHFTKELISEIASRGVMICYLTLHVGLATFRPVKSENVEDHLMHEEYCEISEKAAETINKAKKSGGRIVAVGTTSCRTLESRAGKNGKISPYSGMTKFLV